MISTKQKQVSTDVSANEKTLYSNKNDLLMKLQGRISLRIRREIFAAIPLHKSMSVLEVGVTPDMDLLDSNYFSRAARDMGCEVWVTSPENCEVMAQENRLKWYPFDQFLGGGKQFDVVISSAVIEHVGESALAKMDHLRSLDNASRNMVVVTTPNRYHWMEIHTKIPFIHWLPKHWHRFLLRILGKTQWANPMVLDLLTEQELKALSTQTFVNYELLFKRFRFLGATSNLMVLGTQIKTSEK